ncbi:MAG: DUF1559 domain-containing protein [Planctomycetaceae bacterium]|jgi:prepilin-type N-terminal cleavage/methylation domain-containing protein|nr:DUF1559 domain-containing protein [Planctomycetaceae bacterium]
MWGGGRRIFNQKIRFLGDFSDNSVAPYRLFGFTLVELLTVIAIIGVLIGLLLPAVQAAREAARRASCSNNQKQIAIANHNFYDAKGTFPESNTGISSGNYSNGFSTLTAILPFIEQSAIFAQIEDPYQNWSDRIATYWQTGETPGIMPPCQEAARTKISTFRCASDTSSGLSTAFSNTGYYWYYGPSSTDIAYVEGTTFEEKLVTSCCSDEPYLTQVPTPPEEIAYTPVAATNYVACFGSATGYKYKTVDYTRVRDTNNSSIIHDVSVVTDGVFGGIRRGGKIFDSITDGSSNTLLYSEAIIGDGIYNGAAPDPMKPYTKCAYTNTTSINDPSITTATALYATNDFEVSSLISTTTQWHGWRGYSWMIGKAHSTGFSTFSSPNPTHPDFGVRYGIGFFAARSHHPGGVNSAYADASVHFTNNSINKNEWRRLGAINDDGTDLPNPPTP